jgi:hypothetical protein
MEIILGIVLVLVCLFIYRTTNLKAKALKDVVTTRYVRSFEIYLATYCDLEQEILKKGLRESCPELKGLRDAHLTIVDLCNVDINKTKTESLIKVTNVLNETTQKIESYYPKLV